MRADPRKRLPRPWKQTIHGAIDGKPIRVNKPKVDQSKFYSGKYKCHVVKMQVRKNKGFLFIFICNQMQVIVDNTACPIWYKGLYFGSVHDRRIWNATKHEIENCGSLFLGMSTCTCSTFFPLTLFDS